VEFVWDGKANLGALLFFTIRYNPFLDGIVHLTGEFIVVISKSSSSKDSHLWVLLRVTHTDEHAIALIRRKLYSNLGHMSFGQESRPFPHSATPFLLYCAGY